MARAEPPDSCYHLVEWYHPDDLGSHRLDDTVTRLDGAAAAVAATGAPVRLLVTMAASNDEVLYSLFAAPSPEPVIEACERAGLPAERVTSGVDIRITGATQAACCCLSESVRGVAVAGE